MEKFKSDLLLIKTFLCSFGLEYGVDIASLKNFSKINLLKYGKKVGKLTYYKGNYKVYAKLEDSVLLAVITTDKKEEKLTKIINYELKKYDGYKITGIYKINNNGKNCKPFLKYKDTIKNSFSIFSNNKEISHFTLFSVRNSVYIVNLLNNEYINFNNQVLSHGFEGKHVHVGYDSIGDVLDYTYLFPKDNSDFVYSGGYNLYKDADEKDFDLVKRNYRMIIDEFDPEYENFLEEQRRLVDKFQDGLFDNFINTTLTTLTDNEKDYIFNIKRKNEQLVKIKRWNTKFYVSK